MKMENGCFVKTFMELFEHFSSYKICTHVAHTRGMRWGNNCDQPPKGLNFNKPEFQRPFPHILNLKTTKSMNCCCGT